MDDRVADGAPPRLAVSTGDRFYATAQSVFGITARRSGQRELIVAVLTGREAFAICGPT